MGDILLLCWVESYTGPICGHDCADGEGGDCKIHEIMIRGRDRRKFNSPTIEVSTHVEPR